MSFETYRKERDMKKTVVTVLSGLMGMAAVAGQASLLVRFSSSGPDRYADGTVVADGETYALVWTADGATFAGLTADCKPVDTSSKVVLFAPFAKDGRCPPMLFQIPEEMSNDYAGGRFSICLLDTRVARIANADGTTGYRLSERGADGRPLTVNAFGAAGEVQGASGVVKSGAISLADVGVYSKIESPKIVSIEPKGGRVRLVVDGMSGAADYFVSSGTAINRLTSQPEATREGANVLSVEDNGPCSFYRVDGVRRFR